uniref:Retroviral polymerase SH3-like domain-containing protein n=1 Tax=Lactuca sativa TaxID=4236 RepID=A0A9R1VZ63_LACSA|nr:hypothetical protein LSAT_V11C300136620 [Lactuca sativa]
MKSVFIGYAQNNNAYRLLDNESGVVIESRDVEFFKDKFSRDFENSNTIISPNYSNESDESGHFAINLNDGPKTFTEVMSSIDAPMRKEVINDKIDSIMCKETWELTDLP